jgi:hypothetical protein
MDRGHDVLICIFSEVGAFHAFVSSTERFFVFQRHPVMAFGGFSLLIDQLFLAAGLLRGGVTGREQGRNRKSFLFGSSLDSIASRLVA